MFIFKDYNRSELHGVLSKVLKCDLEVNDFEFQQRNYAHLEKKMKPVILPALIQIVSDVFFLKDYFGCE